MSTTRPAADPAPADTAAAIRTAGFVQVLAEASGDGLAAAGTLARGLQSAAVPFQIRIGTAEGTGTVPEMATVVVGQASPEVDVDAWIVGNGESMSEMAATVAAELGAEPDPVTTLAGALAAGTRPDAVAEGALLENLIDGGRVQQRPGVSLPTTDQVTGLAASTRLRAPFSGSPEAAAQLLADIGVDKGQVTAPQSEVRRRLASAVAIETVRAPDANPRAADSIERALRPYTTPSGPFPTLGGYAEVLEVLAREQPGIGVALAMGDETLVAPAVTTWEEHGITAHRLIDDATTARYDGAFVVRVDDGKPGLLPTIARTVRSFQAPEPIVLAVTAGAAAAVGDPDDDDVTMALNAAAAATEGTTDAASGPGTVRFNGEARDFVRAFREAL